MEFEAVILAGRSSTRLGGADKAQVDIGPATLLERAVEASAGARRIFVVGPRRPGITGVEWVAERHPDGGPAAALADGIDRCKCAIVLVLACDLPFVDGALVRALVSAVAGDGAVATDGGGRGQHLAAAYDRKALVRALDRVRPGEALREALAGLDLIPVAGGDAVRDVDTWEEIEAARVILRGDPR